MSEGNVTSILAKFASGVRYDTLPDIVIAKTRQLVLDCLGNQIGAFGEASAEILHDVIGVQTSTGKCTVVGYGSRTTPLLAGCMNGMLAHLLDMDDAHRDALTKTGSAITPAVMALAEERGCNGEQVVEAVVAGYEIMIHLGLAVNPSHRSRGFHSTATLGAFGAAAAAGRLLGLPPSSMAEALGIAGTQTAGLTAFINSESMTKPFNVGKAVYNGILAALLAERGFRGPPAIIEGQEGFLQGYTDDVDVMAIASDIGTHYRMLESGFKPHAACRYAHGPIDAAIALMRQHGFGALEIERIDVYLSALANRQSNFYEPKSVASAQGSTPFAIAASLSSHTDSLTVAIIKQAFDDDSVWKLHRRIRLMTDASMSYMGRGCRIELHLLDGRCVEQRVDLPRGEPENPMSEAQIADKFLHQAGGILGEHAAAAIQDGVNNLQSLRTVSSLMALTVAKDK